MHMDIITVLLLTGELNPAQQSLPGAAVFSLNSEQVSIAVYPNSGKYSTTFRAEGRLPGSVAFGYNTTTMPDDTLRDALYRALDALNKSGYQHSEEARAVERAWADELPF